MSVCTTKFKTKAAKKRCNARVGAKIRKLRHEGVKQSQAVATAQSMEAVGRLGPRGGYAKVGRAAAKHNYVVVEFDRSKDAWTFMRACEAAGIAAGYPSLTTPYTVSTLGTTKAVSALASKFGGVVQGKGARATNPRTKWKPRAVARPRATGVTPKGWAKDLLDALKLGERRDLVSWSNDSRHWQARQEQRRAASSALYMLIHEQEHHGRKPTWLARARAAVARLDAGDDAAPMPAAKSDKRKSGRYHVVSDAHDFDFWGRPTATYDVTHSTHATYATAHAAAKRVAKRIEGDDHDGGHLRVWDSHLKRIVPFPARKYWDEFRGKYRSTTGKSLVKYRSPRADDDVAF